MKFMLESLEEMGYSELVKLNGGYSADCGKYGSVGNYGCSNYNSMNKGNSNIAYRLDGIAVSSACSGRYYLPDGYVSFLDLQMQNCKSGSDFDMYQHMTH